MPKKMWHNLLKGAGTTGYEISGESTATTFHIRGTSTNVGGTETFNIQFIQDGAQTPSTSETITCAVDAQGNWDYEYSGKKIYSLSGFSTSNTLTALSFVDADDFSRCTLMGKRYSIGWQGTAMLKCANLATLDLSGKKLNAVESISNMFDDNSTLPLIDMSDAELNNCTNAIVMFGYQSQVPNGVIALPKATFRNLQVGEVFAGLKATTINVPLATFDNMQKNVGFEGGASFGLFHGCSSLVNVNISSATFSNLTDARNMFRNCQSISRIELPNATFKELVDAKGMFQGCSNLEEIVWGNSLNFNRVEEVGAIGSAVASGMFLDCTKLKDTSIVALAQQQFSALKVAINWFNGCRTLTKIDLHSMTAPNLYDTWGMFYGLSITDLILSSATFASVTRMVYAGYHCFGNLTALTTFDVPQNSTAISPTSTEPLDLRWSPLNYASMLKVANWVSDLTGYTAHTLTFKTSAWNALTSAEQNSIDLILTAKNWTRVLA